ncbi:MAG: response regulator [Ignavibacteria bacterium]|nr:response regulator [Ignavibacteria bacterium]
MKVLVIEDETTNLKLEHVVMASAGYSVRTGESAEDALRMIKKDKPSVILLDLKLPGMDGLELARRLKADKETKDIVIVAVTGHASNFSKKEALEAGCDAYILKPIDTRKLPKQVAEVVSKKKVKKQR